MPQERILRYNDKDSTNYSNSYANSTVITTGPFGELLINFYEESLRPVLVTEQVLDHPNDEKVLFNHEPHVLMVERERKVSITMNKARALELAKMIMNQYGYEGEDVNGNR